MPLNLPVVVALVVLAGAVVVAGFVWFAPQASVDVHEAMSPTAVAVREGDFAGANAHAVEGHAKILRDGDAFVLRLEGYDATPGPDVHFYLVPAGSSDPESDGVRVDLDGVDGGNAVKRGDFEQRLPAGVVPDDVDAVVVWCTRFNVEFGRATLV